MTVFKYRGASKETFQYTLDGLINDYFWAAEKSTLNDPYEGFVDSETMINQINQAVNLFFKNNKSIQNALVNAQNVLSGFLSFTDSAGILSLSKDPLNELLWAHYANEHRGFCIEYDRRYLTRFYRNEFMFDVDYKENPSSISASNFGIEMEKTNLIKKVIGTKSTKWKYEQEVRLVTSKFGKHQYDYRAVKSIYFGLRMSEDQKQKIMISLQGRDIKYFQIELKKNSYEFVIRHVVDLYPTKKKYLYEKSKVMDNAIDPIEKWSSFVPYFKKLAEIVRRDPYCEEIASIDIKVNSNKTNPTFFVNFKWKNRIEPLFAYQIDYFHLNEIDAKYNEITDLNSC